MAIRKRASGASLVNIREDEMIRVSFRAGLMQVEREIKDADAFGDVSEKVNRLYERKAYLERHLASSAKLSIVAV